MDKKQVIDKLEAAWKAFVNSFDGLSDEQLLKPGVMGDWSVKDLIAHVSWWEEETLNHLPEILEGIRPQRYSVLYGGIDAFNALMTDKWRVFSLKTVVTQAKDTHYKLITYLWGVPDIYFETDTKFRRRLRLDTYGHYPIHTQAILAWRESHA